MGGVIIQKVSFNQIVSAQRTVVPAQAKRSRQARIGAPTSSVHNSKSGGTEFWIGVLGRKVEFD